MARGGYRNGAGRPATRPQAEDCRALDIRRMSRAGCIKPHSQFKWRWTNQSGEATASVDCTISAESAALTVSYNWKRPNTSVWHAASQRIALTATPCHYGGSRTWMMCPLCQRRSARVYIMGERLKCGHCARISYASQRGDSVDRAWVRQSKAEAKLLNGWRRPKRMRQTTWERLIGIILDCERQRDQAVDAILSKIVLTT